MAERIMSWVPRRPVGALRFLAASLRVVSVLLLFTLGLFCAPAKGAETRLSRTMQRAIQLYEKGKEQEALDHFIDVLSRGDPDEKTLASDYITKINLRMASGDSSKPSTPPSKPGSAAPVSIAAPVPPAPKAGPAPSMQTPFSELVSPAAAPARAPAPASTAPAALPPAVQKRNEATMRKEIATKIRSRRKDLIARLSREMGVQIDVEDGEEGQVGSIAVPADLLFDQEIAFKIPQSEKILSLMSGIAYLSGDALLLIWPEKFQTAEPSLVDMRRAMALRNYFLSAGLSPARVQANLIGTAGNPPKKFYGFSGPVIQFRYGEEFKLTRQSTGLAAEGGPHVSIGAYPQRFVPIDSEGALIEFSVLEGEEGVANWRFQILPAANPDKAAPIQELTGEGPVFHQVFWNGHYNYFSETMPYGRYPCLLTAKDYKGVQSTTRFLLSLDPPKATPPPAKPAGMKAELNQGQEAGQGPGLKAALKSAAALIPKRPAKGKPAKPALKSSKKKGKPSAVPAKKAKDAKNKKKKGLKKPGAAPAVKAEPGVTATPEQENPSFTGGSVNSIQFESGSIDISPNGMQELSKAVETINYYPLAKIIITGYAYTGESNPSTLAEKRAQVVKDLLISKYGLGANESLMRTGTKVVEENTPKVEIGIEPSEK